MDSDPKRALRTIGPTLFELKSLWVRDFGEKQSGGSRFWRLFELKSLWVLFELKSLFLEKFVSLELEKNERKNEEMEALC